jgi:ABC-type nitrate/sulfonate/bicarbonate transport system substrate-binding protein
MTKLPPSFLKYVAATAVSAMALNMAVISTGFSQNVKVRVGATVSVDAATAAFLLALDNGTFTKAGLDIDTRVFVQSNQKYDSIKAEAVDVDINMGAINAAQLHAAGVPIVVLRATAPADVWGVIVRKDSKITKPADFKGKKYGVISLSGTNFGATYLAFKTQGVSLMRDVKVSTLPPAGLVTAIENGDIDGGTTFEPFLSSAVKTGAVKHIFSPGAIYQQKFGEPFIALTVATRKDFLGKNRAAMTKFMTVLEQTMATLPQNQDAAAKAMVKYMPEMKLSEADTKELIVKYLPGSIKSQNTPTFLKTAQHMYDRLLEAKQLTQPVKATDFWVKL